MKAYKVNFSVYSEDILNRIPNAEKIFKNESGKLKHLKIVDVKVLDDDCVNIECLVSEDELDVEDLGLRYRIFQSEECGN